MLEEDLRTLGQILVRAVEESGLRRRDVERALKLRNGSLGYLADGSVDLRVDQLTALARLLRIPPGDLLRAGCPKTRAAATYRLTDWLGPLDNPLGKAAPAPAANPAPTREELMEMIRTALREELAAREGR